MLKIVFDENILEILFGYSQMVACKMNKEKRTIFEKTLLKIDVGVLTALKESHNLRSTFFDKHFLNFFGTML